MNKRLIRRMIEGRTITQISRLPHLNDGRPMQGILEVEHQVTIFKQYLPAGRAKEGAIRKHDLIQFYADPGGLRTVRAIDIVV